MLFSIVLALLVFQCQAIHFYNKQGTTKCFFEELPTDTLVVVKYDAELVEDLESQQFVRPSELKIYITVDETFDNDHRVVSQSLASKGEFTFTSLAAGEHKFCLTSQYKPDKSAQFRIFIDLVFGHSNIIDTKKMDQVGYVQWKVNELAARAEEIKIEHDNIRAREASFRDQSESANERIVRWTLFQLFMLIGIGIWQMKHLKTFFVKEKVI